MPLNKPSGNMYPWAYTWNPLAGKCPHECYFCYVEGKIAPWMRRMGSNKFYEPLRLVESEFKVPLIVPNGYIVFVESCGDLFAYDVEESWIWQVLNRIKKFPQTTFLLQSKNPERFFDFNIPQNCILGTTIESNRDYHLSKAPSPKERYHVFFMLNNDRDFEGNKIYRLMVSIEPVMDFDLDELVFWMQEIDPEFISIGADSGNNNLVEPSPKKLQELIEILSRVTEVKQKENLSRLLPAKQLEKEKK